MQFGIFLSRLLLSLLFLVAAVQKIFGFEVAVGLVRQAGLPFAEPLVLLSALFEFSLALMLIVGWKSRYAAYALSVYAFIVTLVLHTDFSLSTQALIFLKNLGVVGGLLALGATGSGTLSLDHYLARFELAKRLSPSSIHPALRLPGIKLPRIRPPFPQQTQNRP